MASLPESVYVGFAEAEELPGESANVFPFNGHLSMSFTTRFLHIGLAVEQLNHLSAGFASGLEGRKRDWSQSAYWHFGYMRGRLKRYKETGKIYL